MRYIDPDPSALPCFVLARKTRIRISRLTAEAVYKILAFSPVSASAQGLHKYNGKISIPVAADDMSSASISKAAQHTR